MCSHMKRTRARSSCSKQANWTVRFDKPDGPVSSAPTAVRGTVGSDEGVIFLAEWCLTRGKKMNHDNFGGCSGG
jgi:hypothetical protein